MCSLLARVTGTFGLRVTGLMVRTDTTGCREHGSSRLRLVCCGRPAIGVGVEVCTFGTQGTGVRTSDSTAASIMVLATLERVMKADIGAATAFTITAPSTTSTL